jgi:hypothetical protein
MTCSYLVFCKNSDETRPDRTPEWVQSKPHRGDIVGVVEAGTPFGRRESMQVWVADGNNPADYPGDYGIVHVVDDHVDLSTAESMFCHSAVKRPTTPADQEHRVEEDGTSTSTVTVYKFGWRLRLSELTPAQQQTFASDYMIELTQDEFNSISEHKGDRKYFDPAAPDGKGSVRPDAGQPLPWEELPVRGRPNG